MGSPTEYIAELERNLKQVSSRNSTLEEQLDRALRERDEYQEQVHQLQERVRNLMSASSTTAQTVVTALDRIQLMDPVIKSLQDPDIRSAIADIPWMDTVNEVLIAYERVVANRD